MGTTAVKEEFMDVDIFDDVGEFNFQNPDYSKKKAKATDSFQKPNDNFHDIFGLAGVDATPAPFTTRQKKRKFKESSYLNERRQEENNFERDFKEIMRREKKRGKIRD